MRGPIAMPLPRPLLGSLRAGPGAHCALLHGLALALALGVKARFGAASADELGWLLGPTCALAGWLGDLELERIAGLGFVSHEQRIVVGPPCAGLRFLVIAFAALFCAFGRRFPDARSQRVWLLASACAAYALTIATNAARIVLAARLYAIDVHDPVWTPERVHRGLGVLVYCSALLLAQAAAGAVVERILRPGAPARACARRPAPLWIPLAIYAAVTVVLPLASRADRADPGQFIEHAAFVCAGGAAVALLLRASERGLDRLCSRARGRRPEQ